MDTKDMIELRGELQAIKMTMALMLAGAAMQNPGALAKMHEALTGLVLDGVKSAGDLRADMPAGFAQTFEVSALATLDGIFSTAGALK